MKRLTWGAGYTIVEVIIVLAVSSALLTSALLAFNGQAGRTEFATTVRDFDSRLQDIINDVSTGYYPNNGKIVCTSMPGPGGGITITTSGPAVELGTNGDCIFLGKVILFTPNGKSSKFQVFTVAGRRLKDLSIPATQLSEVKPQLIERGRTQQTSYPEVSETVDLGGSIKFTTVNYSETTTPPSNLSFAIGFFSTLGSYGANGLASGSNTLELRGFGVGGPMSTLIGINPVSIDFVDNFHANAPSLVSNPITSGSVEICLASQSSKQVGKVTIYGASKQLKVDSVIQTGNACS